MENSKSRWSTKYVINMGANNPLNFKKNEHKKSN